MPGNPKITATCQECGIVFDIEVNNECPLCELRVRVKKLENLGYMGYVGDVYK